MAVRFMYNNLWDSGTLTASSEDSDFPASNTQHHWHLLHWRSTGDEDEWLKVNLGSAQDIKVFVIKYHNFSAGATLKIQANSSDSWTTPPVDETLSITSDIIVKFWSSAQSYQWWRIYIDDTGNSDGYLKIGRVFLGNHVELSRVYSYGYEYQYIDPSDVVFSANGQIASNQKERYKRFSYTFRGLTSTDKSNLETIFDSVGLSIPYFFCEDSSSPSSSTFYVLNSAAWVVANIPDSDRYELRLELEEAR